MDIHLRKMLAGVLEYTFCVNDLVDWVGVTLKHRSFCLTLRGMMIRELKSVSKLLVKYTVLLFHNSLEKEAQHEMRICHRSEINYRLLGWKYFIMNESLFF